MNGTIREYNKYNNNLYFIYFVFNRKKEGEYKEYYDNGQLCIMCNYKNDKLNGEYKEYDRDGELWKLCTMKCQI